MVTVIALAAAILILAVLYSAVGHAGASGYLAAMAIVTTMPQDQMKAIALTLNICVGIIGAFHFIREGHFKWSLFWPFAVGATPLAFVGGLWTLPAIIFQPLIGLVLLYAALMLVSTIRSQQSCKETPVRTMPSRPVALVCGGGLGLLAGLTGTGGGIFLSPLLMLTHWATPQRTAAASIVFVLVNSIAGLGGVVASDPSLPASLPIYIAVAVIGGFIGSRLGARKLPGDWIRLLLACVLIIAAIKMFLTAMN